MAVFAYRALRPNGARATGLVDAASEHAAWNLLRERGLHPTRVAPSVERPGSSGTAHAAKRAELLRQVGVLVGGGVALPDALAIVQDTAPEPFASALATVAEAVRSGIPFATACERDLRLLDATECTIVAAGEASGTLAASLRDVAHDLDRRTTRRRELRRVLTYPLVLVLVGAAVLAGVHVLVLPQIASLFADTPSLLPMPTRFLLATNRAASQTWPALLALAIGTGVLARHWLRRPGSRTDVQRALLRLPWLGAILRDVTTARFAHGATGMLRAGLPLDVALAHATRAVTLEPIRVELQSVRDAIVAGHSLRAALGQTSAASPALLGLVAAGEETGDLTDAFHEAALLHDAAADHRIRTALALLEPGLILVVAALVFGLVWAVLVPFLAFDPLSAP